MSGQGQIVEAESLRLSQLEPNSSRHHQTLNKRVGYNNIIEEFQLQWVYQSSGAISAFTLWEQIFKVSPCWLVRDSAGTLSFSFCQTAHDLKDLAEIQITGRPGQREHGIHICPKTHLLKRNLQIVMKTGNSKPFTISKVQISLHYLTK